MHDRSWEIRGMEILSVEDAVARLPRRGRLLLAPGCGQPLTLCDALAAAHDQFEDLEIYTGLMLAPTPLLEHTPQPFRLTTIHVTAQTEKLVARGRPTICRCVIRSCRWHSRRRDRCRSTRCSSRSRRPTATATARSVPPSVRASTWWTARHSSSRRSTTAPRGRRGHAVHVSKIDVAADVDRALIDQPAPKIGATERTIGGLVAELVPNGACFQIGIGAIPQAILEALGGHRDLGIHSGMICDGMIPLIERGVANGACKSIDRGLAVGGEAMGTETLYRFLDSNPAVHLVSARYSHGLDTTARISGFTAINSAIEVDLSGQVNAEWVAGRQMSGIGGQFDYVEAAMYSSGGRSIVALPATAARGTASRIVRTLAAGTPVTTPRCCVDFVVTEFGVADLRGKGVHARAAALAAIAHPEFRYELIAH